METGLDKASLIQSGFYKCRKIIRAWSGRRVSTRYPNRVHEVVLRQTRDGAGFVEQIANRFRTLETRGSQNFVIEHLGLCTVKEWGGRCIIRRWGTPASALGRALRTRAGFAESMTD
jgi:hypothetical protein